MTKPQLLTTLGVSVLTVLSIGSYATGVFDPVTFQNQLDNHEQRIQTIETKTGITPPPTPSNAPTSAGTSTSITYITEPTASVTVSPTASTTSDPSQAGVPASSIEATPQATPPPPTPVTEQDVIDLFGRIAPPGEQRDRKMLFCYSLYRDRGWPVSYAQAGCYETLFLTYPTY